METDLLYQISIFLHTACAGSEDIRKIDPRDIGRDKPQNIRNIVNRSRLESHLENEPEYKDGDKRLHKGPHRPQKRGGIPGAKIIFCQIHHQSPVGEDGFYKQVNLFHCTFLCRKCVAGGFTGQAKSMPPVSHSPQSLCFVTCHNNERVMSLRLLATAIAF